MRTPSGPRPRASVLPTPRRCDHLFSGHRRRLGNQQSAGNHPVCQPSAIGTDALDDDQRRLPVDPLHDPGQVRDRVLVACSGHRLIDQRPVEALTGVPTSGCRRDVDPDDKRGSATMGIATEFFLWATSYRRRPGELFEAGL